MIFLFAREKREYRRLRKLIFAVNTKLTKQYRGEPLARAGKELGLLDHGGTLNLEKEGDIEAMMDRIIFPADGGEGNAAVERFLAQLGEEFLPALEREVMAAYAAGPRFSLYEVANRIDRYTLALDPLLDGEAVTFYDADVCPVADRGWIIAGRFFPFQGRMFHTGVIYPFAPEAKEKVLESLAKEGTVCDHSARYPIHFYRLYRDIGIPLGQR
jgi:hypothetical protein